MEDEGVGFTVEVPEAVFEAVMVSTIALMAVGAVIFLAVQLSKTWREEPRMKAIEELSRKTRLAIPDDLRAPLAHAVAFRTRGLQIASLLGLAVTVLVIFPWDTSPPDLGMTPFLLAVAAVNTVQFAGSVVGAMLGRATAPDSPRTARLTPLEYTDLVAPVERRLVAVSTVIGLALPTLLLAAQATPWFAPEAAAFVDARVLLIAGATAAGLALSLPAAARRLAASRAIAGGEHALAWSDALAARTVRDLAYVVVTLSGYTGVLAFMGLGPVLFSGSSAVAGISINVSLYLGIAALVWVAVAVLRREPERHVQRTLWPQFGIDPQ